MKKLLLLSACISINTIYADELSTAIQKSDVNAVKQLLESRSFNNKNFVKYLNIADETIGFRREELISQQIRPGYCTADPESNNCYKKAGFFAGVGVGSSALPLFLPYRYTDKSDQYHSAFGKKMYSFLRSQRDSIDTWCNIGMITSVIAALYFRKNGIYYTDLYYQKRYRNAMSVKELLYDYCSEEFPTQ